MRAQLIALAAAAGVTLASVATAPAQDADAFYRIVNREHKGLCIEVKGGKIQMGKIDAKAAGQLWQVKRLKQTDDDVIVRITNRSVPGKSLSLLHDKNGEPTEDIAMHETVKSDSQEWELLFQDDRKPDQPDSPYTRIWNNELSDESLDIIENGDSMQLRMRKYSRSNDVQTGWKFVKVDPKDSGSSQASNGAKDTKDTKDAETIAPPYDDNLPAKVFNAVEKAHPADSGWKIVKALKKKATYIITVKKGTKEVELTLDSKGQPVD